MVTKVLGVYDEYFKNSSERSIQRLDWERFKSTELTQCTADFSVDERNWKKSAIQVSLLILKIILFPWGLHDLLRYTVQRLVMIGYYPAQSRILGTLNQEELDVTRKMVADSLNRDGYVVRHVALEKNGVRYSGLLIGSEGTITNGQWALQATGNFEWIENSAESIARIYGKLRFNTLLVNGPNVGRSKGQATPESMGEAQEVAISFLETALEAKKIVIAGRSLGGAAVGEAIMKHKLKKNVKYLVVRQMSFDRASNVCAEFVSYNFPILKCIKWFLRLVVKWSCEMDSVAASKKLQKEGIEEVIVQKGYKRQPLAEDDFDENDGVIPRDASLGYSLMRERVTENKVFICVQAEHMTDLAIEIAGQEILKI